MDIQLNKDNDHPGLNLNPKGLRLTNVLYVNKKNGKNTPELVQGYMDDELMHRFLC